MRIHGFQHVGNWFQLQPWTLEIDKMSYDYEAGGSRYSINLKTVNGSILEFKTNGRDDLWFKANSNVYFPYTVEVSCKENETDLQTRKDAFMASITENAPLPEVDANTLISSAQVANGSIQNLNKGFMPIGAVYTQYPNQLPPSDLFFGTWTNISNEYAGDFFRAEGGNASAFQSGRQADEIKSHTHTVNSATTAGPPTISNENNYNDQPYQVLKRSATVTTGNFQNPRIIGGSINVSVESTGGAETRPKNQTVKIWKRTA